MVLVSPGRHCAMPVAPCGSFFATFIARGCWPRISARSLSFRNRTVCRGFRVRSDGSKSSQVLSGVDRRAPCGKRDYAMLLLLATYGLRGCEVAALTLHDIDWRNDRLKISERKAGNSTAYPLSTVVGAAIVDYLKNGRPVSKDRQLFLRALAPF